ncbi:hypothetical protein DYB38_000342 [Aphanomyces astaci]|uniref:Uncharacterized protein n=1 Tax=Aphanomyces astaci TaxID=112090 RepID=A0A397CL62_APHAT|nr:hypothetical protein DYB38_000342 [Aphanomyces astaci]RHY60805.1 hypothetical protein DYB34_000615 [Aphanomyces astaci]
MAETAARRGREWNLRTRWRQWNEVRHRAKQRWTRLRKQLKRWSSDKQVKELRCLWRAWTDVTTRRQKLREFLDRHQGSDVMRAWTAWGQWRHRKQFQRLDKRRADGCEPTPTDAMACGLTPEIVEMLANVSKYQEDGKKVSAEEYLAQVEHSKQARDRQEAVQAKLDRERGYDWTREYEKWSAWEDPDELAAKEHAARVKSERASMRTSCNHDHSAEQKLMDMTTRAKLTQCDTFRRLGNRFFAHGQYQRAAYHFHHALVYFEYIFSDTDAEQVEMDDLKKRILLNFALCRLKTKHVDQAILNASLAMKLDGESVKALYIRAMGYRMQDKFELAQVDLDRALALAPLDSALVHEKHVLAAKKAAYVVKSKQLGAAMFGRNQPTAQPQPTTSAMFVGDGLSLEMEFRQPSTIAASDVDSVEFWQPSTRGKHALESLLGEWKLGAVALDGQARSIHQP